jgi:hypothetical protein
VRDVLDLRALAGDILSTCFPSLAEEFPALQQDINTLKSLVLNIAGEGEFALVIWKVETF